MIGELFEFLSKWFTHVKFYASCLLLCHLSLLLEKWYFYSGGASIGRFKVIRAAITQKLTESSSEFGITQGVEIKGAGPICGQLAMRENADGALRLFAWIRPYVSFEEDCTNRVTPRALLAHILFDFTNSYGLWIFVWGRCVAKKPHDRILIGGESCAMSAL